MKNGRQDRIAETLTKDLYPDEGNKVKMVHHKQLSNNILPYNEGFEGKKTGYRAKSSL